MIELVSERSKLRNPVPGILLVVIAGLCAVGAWWASLAPKAVGADAPDAAFSAARAFKHVEHMADDVHPMGSPAIEKVYAYIEVELKALGVEYVVERPIMKMNHRNDVEQNGAILARIPGTASTGGFAVDAHFDSTPYGPGAADDLSGVAAMLETIRALKAAPPLMNNVYFCFSDKEETDGTTGGPGVFINHPWFKDVHAVLGLEARGTCGPALMFEMGAQNGFLIRELAKSGAHPRASSYMFDVYNRMPFGSDFTLYKMQGLAGMNVAYIDGFCNYHTMLDDPDHLSLASLQHHGDYTLGLARRLGNISLADCRGPDATYFNLIGDTMVIYPRSWGWPLAMLAWVVFAAALARGVFVGVLKVRGVCAAAGWVLLTGLAIVAVTAGQAAIIFFALHEEALYKNAAFSFDLLLTAVIVMEAFVLIARRRSREELFAGAVVWWALLLLAAQLLLPGGAYAAVWPLLSLSVGLLALTERWLPQPVRFLIASASTLPGIVILTPNIVGMSYGLTAMFMPAALMFVLLLAEPVLALAGRPVNQGARTWGALGLAACLFWLVFVIHLANSKPTPEHPHLNSLSYAVDFDKNEAWWVSGDRAVDEWTAHFFEPGAPRVPLADFLGVDDGYTYLRGAAPMPYFSKPVLAKEADVVENGRRQLKLFVKSSNTAQRIELHMQSDTPVYAAKVLGVDVKGSDKHWTASLNTVQKYSGEVELEVDAGKPVEILVREITYNLPNLKMPPRPDWMMTQTNRQLSSQALSSNYTYALTTFSF